MQSGSSSKKNQYTWSREATTTLIHLYEQYPILYITTAPEYHNKPMKNNAFVDVTATFNKRTMANISVQDVQKKIHGIRTQYLGEVNKIKKSQASGASTDEVYVPKLWCFEQMHFLRPSSQVVTQGESNLNTLTQSQSSQYGETEAEQDSLDNFEAVYDDNDEENDVIFEGDISQVSNLDFQSSNEKIQTRPSSSSMKVGQPTKKRKVVQRSDKVESILDMATKTLNILNENDQQPQLESKNSLFGKTIAAELDSIMDEEALDEVKLEIFGLIMQAKKKSRQSRR